MKTSFEELHRRAIAVDQQIKGGADSVLTILKALCEVLRDAERDTLDAVENRLLHHGKDH